MAEPEGVEKLFRYAQLLIVTCFKEALVGTVGTEHDGYLAWKDPYPVTEEEIAKAVGAGLNGISAQQRLIGGLLRPAHLLDVVQNFTLFDQKSGRRVKIVPRYQQFRATHKTIQRLQKRSPEERNGIVWHTQGSGKSLTMVFLIRKMRNTPGLRRYKIVLVTDRVKLEDQLTETAQLSNEPLERAGSILEFEDLLRQPGAGLVFGMIQKMQGAEGENALEDQEQPKKYPALNDAEEILLLVDEAHRSHTSTLHARLMAALPNCAKIGFTGTPILEEDKQPTHAIFGTFIDTYDLKQSQVDGMTVPIRYEGRETKGVIKEEKTLDQIFADLFSERTAEEIREIQSQYATQHDVRESKEMIAAKAQDMLAHYVTTVMPDGYKAQVVAASRRAAVRYQKAFQKAQKALIAALDKLAQAPSDVQKASPYAAALAYRERIRNLEFAAVFSKGENDPRSWRKWTREGRQKTVVSDFKKTFDPEEGSGNTALLVVVNMLLTGFDAPIEQAMYLDRHMRGYELLQAIARVNRTYASGVVVKENGLVVDYYGLAEELHEAIEIYTSHHIQGVLVEFDKAEIPKLRDRYQRVVSLFTDRGLSLQDTEACVNLLRSAKLRAQFLQALRQFLQTLNAVLPRPDALPYVDDARQLGLIRTLAAKRYRDQHLKIAGAEAKVRKLLDDHILAQGVDPKIPPLDILDAEFENHVRGMNSKRAQAAEMEFALRHHIRKHYREDPVYFQRLSERLEKILKSFEENWELQTKAFRELIRQHQETQENVGHEDKKYEPFLRLLMGAQVEEHVDDQQREIIAQHTIKLVTMIQKEIRQVDFWHSSKTPAQEKLRGDLLQFLDNHDLVPFEEQNLLADALMSTAKANHLLLTEKEL